MNKKKKDIFFANLIGVINSLTCGIPLYISQIGGIFSIFDLGSTEFVFMVMMFFGTNIQYLVFNLVSVNVLYFLLRITKSKKISLMIVFLGAIISVYSYHIYNFLIWIDIGNYTGLTKIPEEIYATTLIYLMGFSWLIFRNKKEELPGSFLIEFPFKK